jgi:hypothetical protein
MKDRHRLANSTVLHVLFAFLAMGSWAVFANRGHPLGSRLVAGALQGTLSALITLFLKRSIEVLNARFTGMWRLSLPPAIAAAVSLTLLTTLHSLSGTPEILQTIAVPLTVATSYAAFYNYALTRLGPEDRQ